MWHSVELEQSLARMKYMLSVASVIIIIMKEHTGKEGSGMSAFWTGPCLDGDLKDKTRLGS